MKAICLFVFFCCFFDSLHSFGQSPKAIEADLYQSFKKIGYWKGYGYEHIDSMVMANDSLAKANNSFGQKLKHYTAACPFTLTMSFKILEDRPLAIHLADDGNFRVYSWDTEEGGTMHFFENVLQYKSGAAVYSILQKDTGENGNGYVYEYGDIYTLKTNGKTYYLATFSGRFSTKDIIRGIQVFSIENGKLNDDVKLIKTTDGLQNKLIYSFNIFSVTHKIKDEDIHYDRKIKTISLPVVLPHGKVTNSRIVYKFNGRYFESVKN